MTSPTMERTRLVERTPDVAAARTAVARTHRTFGLDVAQSGVPFRFEETITGTVLLSLESTQCTGTVRGEVAPDTAVTVVWLKSGRGAVDGKPLLRGRPVLYREGRQSFRWDGFQKDLMRIDRATVEQVAAERGGWNLAPLEFKPHHVPEGAPLAAWWLVVRAVAAEILGHVGPVPREREEELTRFAAAGLLTAVPHWPVGQGREAPARTRLTKAEAFLLDHIAERITVDDVAQAAGMSVRGLQGAFQRIHGVSPLFYLKGIRLLLAREQLESGEAESVAAVARSVGLTHLGRFAASYKAEFGQLPGDVLRGIA
ncbi:AraC family transcriptional regulator [Curtobacterium sp. BRB10]|uniref:helix-turn-helix domain-containing protein n=1 Tax=Curtobacterium sp. BRB10 TaxID=2962579 RepID=UPI0028811975|nr:AraC family transcriptional regulator [Curtobacterium sp. BRB10]MDT0235383.1 AraC family transcriptional regulator [Curtobacterium sp. BRB10]